MKKTWRNMLAVLMLLAMVCTSSALADEECFYVRSKLPECYSYPIVGASHVFSDTPCVVYAKPDKSSRKLTTLVNGTPIHVDNFLANGWAEIWYFADDAKVAVGDYPGSGSIIGYARADQVSPEFIYLDTMTVMAARPGERVNLRTKPNKNSTSLGKYYTGTIARTLGDWKNGYVKVQIGQTVGYMDERYLNLGPTVNWNELYTLRVNNRSGSGANIRKQPESKSEIIKTAPNGADVTVIGVRADGWIQVIYEAENGYMKKDLLSGSNDARFKW